MIQNGNLKSVGCLSNLKISLCRKCQQLQRYLLWLLELNSPERGQHHPMQNVLRLNLQVSISLLAPSRKLLLHMRLAILLPAQMSECSVFGKRTLHRLLRKSILNSVRVRLPGLRSKNWLHLFQSPQFPLRTRFRVNSA